MFENWKQAETAELVDICKKKKNTFPEAVNFQPGKNLFILRKMKK